jgi:hypothetical protein
LITCFIICQAQIGVPEIDTKGGAESAPKDFIKPPAIGDVGTTSNSIADILTSKLSLPGAQKQN